MRIPPSKFDFMEKQLSKMREKSGMTLAEVSEASHVPLSTVARIFSGQTSDPGVRTLTAIVSAMGGSIDDLVGIPRPAPSDQTEVINHLRHELRVREKWLVRLFVFVVVVIGLVALATLWDIFTPAVGYIRY